MPVSGATNAGSTESSWTSTSRPLIVILSMRISLAGFVFVSAFGRAMVWRPGLRTVWRRRRCAAGCVVGSPGTGILVEHAQGADACYREGPRGRLGDFQHVMRTSLVWGRMRAPSVCTPLHAGKDRSRPG